MTNSDHPAIRAAKIISEIQCSLADARIQEAIDDPVDEVIAAVDTRKRLSSARELIGHVAEVIRKLYVRLPMDSRCFSELRARDEAAFLLNQCYGGLPNGGFESAILEATDDRVPGLDWLYHRLGEYLKARLRQEYVNGVFSRYVDPADWDTNLAIAATLLEKLRPYLPEGAPAHRPEQFVDSIPDLFFAAQRSEYPTTSVFMDRFPTTT